MVEHPSNMCDKCKVGLETKEWNEDNTNYVQVVCPICGTEYFFASVSVMKDSGEKCYEE